MDLEISLVLVAEQKRVAHAVRATSSAHVASDAWRRKMDYKSAASFVESFSNISLRKNFGPEAKDPSFFLERMKYFLDLLGNPEKDFKYIHITGTAGKGTVSTMVQEILNASGTKAGLFTSPYVTTTIEKIKVGDKYIAPDELVEIVEYLKPFIKKACPSAFEIFLAIAFIYFKKQRCEWVVLEVGLGGRYDATNVITSPKVTAITNIDYDHTEILGKKLREIAYDKAGIIKNGSMFFTAEQRPVLQNLFKKICKEKGAAFNVIEKQKNHTEYNKVLATRIAEAAGISRIAIEKGIKNTSLPCRFEVMQEKPLIILDGAHNRAKIRSTVYNLRDLKYDKLIVILSISNTKKDNIAIVEPIASIADEIILTSTATEERRSVHPSALLPYIKKYKKNKTKVEIVMSPKEAIILAKKGAKKEDCILVTGSFFLAGDLRTLWFSEEWVLKNRRSF